MQRGQEQDLEMGDPQRVQFMFMLLRRKRRAEQGECLEGEREKQTREVHGKAQIEEQVEATVSADMVLVMSHVQSSF